mgnify:CR=1 FL=1
MHHRALCTYTHLLTLVGLTPVVSPDDNLTTKLQLLTRKKEGEKEGISELLEHVQVVFEFMTASEVTMPQGWGSLEDALATYLETGMGETPCALVFLHRPILRSALGPVFGGMVTRWTDLKSKK